MKKVIFFALICLASFSCKKESFQPGQYVAREGQYVISVNTSKLKIWIFDKTGSGEYIYFSGSGSPYYLSGNTASGEYPNFIYSFDNSQSVNKNKLKGKIVFECYYADFNNFTSTVIDQPQELHLPKTLHFIKDDKPLDSNGDLILDEMQIR